jgi:hypothetical protein
VGSYTSSIIGLHPNTTYYLRAYASNDKGIAYGKEVTFTTTKKELTVDGSFTASNKTYDGTTDATIATNNLGLSGVVGADDVSLTNVVVAFGASSAGTGITVSVTSADLTGTDANNYTLSLSGAPITTADITAKELTIDGSFTADNKIYDGTVNAAIATNSLSLSGIVGSDDVTLASEVAAFAGADVASGIEVSLASADLTGSDAGNYSLSLSGSPTTTADITAKELTVTGTSVENKDYDGTAEATLSGATLSGVVSGDAVSLDNATSGTFAQTDIGTGLGVTTSMTIIGTDAGNYTLTQPSGLTGDITAKELTVTGISVENKVYDGTDEATLSGAILSGVLSGDAVSLDNATSGTFAQSYIGTGLGVTTSMTIIGTDAGNYTLRQPSGLKGDITAKELVVTADDQTREQCAGNPEFTISYSGFVESEDKTLLISEPTASCTADETSVPGNYDITVSGGEADNYYFTYESGTLTITEDVTNPSLSVKNIVVDLDETGSATISPADLVESASDNCSLADTTLSQSEFTTDDVGDNNIDVTVSDVNGNSTTKTAVVTINEIATGMDDFTDDIKINMYPNPTKGRLSVVFSDEHSFKQIKVLDLTGLPVIYEKDVKKKNILDLSSHPAGIYLIILETEAGEVKTRKIIKD